MFKIEREQKRAEAVALRETVMSTVKTELSGKGYVIEDVPTAGDPQIKIDNSLVVQFQLESRSNELYSGGVTGRIRAVYWGHDYKRINRLVGKDVAKFAESLAEFIVEDRRSVQAEKDRHEAAVAGDAQRSALKAEFPFTRRYNVTVNGTGSKTKVSFDGLTIEQARQVLEAVAALYIFKDTPAV